MRRALGAFLLLASLAVRAGLVLPPLSIEKSLALDGSADTGVAQVGVARAIAPAQRLEAARSVRWSRTPEGRWRGRLEVTVGGAAAARVAVAKLPDDARVTFGADGFAPHVVRSKDAQAAIAALGVLWGPVVEGERQWVEVETRAAPQVAGFEVTAISHLTSSPGASPRTIVAKADAQSCHQDVACAASSAVEFRRTARAVAKLVYTVDGATYACTGTLVADSAVKSGIPYLLTAKHCIGSQEAASTANTFWFLEADGCGSKALVASKQLSGGAKLVYTGSLSDVALVQLRDTAPPDIEPVELDTTSPLNDDPVVAIHHPRGDLKKFSSGKVVNAAEGTGGALISVGWIAGSTEPGSSGSGLFALRGDRYRVRGALRGGSASCASSGDLSDPTNRDYYARIDQESAELAKLLTAPAAPLVDYTDMYEATDAPGSGLSFVQHASRQAFATWFTYDAGGTPTWLVIPGGTWQSAARFSGQLYRASRAAGPLDVAPVGTATIDFDAGGARLTLSYGGQVKTATLVRQSY